jgi:hypothetical protein
VVLVGLNEVKVGSFTLREAVLAVELQLGSDDGVLTPAVHGEGGLGENECAGIRNAGVHVRVRSCRVVGVGVTEVGLIVSNAVRSGIPPLCISTRLNIGGAGIIEETGGINVLINGFRASERVDGVGKSINGVGIVEGLSAEQAVQELIAVEGRAVVDVLIRLDNPDEFFNGVVKVELDLVRRRTDGFITGELELFNEVLVGVLCHASALIGVQENVVNIEGSGNKGLVVCCSNTTTSGGAIAQGTNGPQTLVDGTDIEIDLDFVVLKGDQGQSKTGVTAVPELEGNIKGGFREGVTGSANLARSVALARTVNIIERRIGDKGEFGGVSDHAVVTADLVNGQSEVVPDVHPVTVLAINALTTDFNFNLRNKLFTGKVEPTSINCRTRGAVLHLLVDFGESNLKVSAVCKITIAADSASNTTTEIGLSVKGLFDGFHSKVGVTFV